MALHLFSLKALLTLKSIGAYGIMAGGAVQLLWALTAHRRRRTLTPSYYRFALALHGIIIAQVVLGLALLLKGFPFPSMHQFYGVMVGAGAAAILVLRRRSAIGQRYRAKPLVHAALGLFILLLALRAWMAA